MRRALSLSFPLWSTDLVLRRIARHRRSRASDAETTLVLTREAAGRQLVERGCRRALAGGVRPGMTVAQARALFPVDALTALPHDPEREGRSLRALAEWATRFSPICAPDLPDGLLLDIGGCERLYGGEKALLDAAVDATEGLGFHVRGAVAATAGCAWALAHYGRKVRSIVPLGREREALAPLPIQALRLEDVTIQALAEVGVERIEHLLAIERKDLAARFGGDILLALDRATGQALEAIDPVRPTPPPRLERVFPGPVKQIAAILLCTRELVEELTFQLERRASGARELEIELARSDTPPWRLRLPLSRASSSAKHLWSLLEPQLERAHLGFGVEVVAVTATRVGTLHPRQARLDSHSENGQALDRSLAELVDVFSGRLGPERTVRMDTVESHVPEHAFRSRSAAGETQKTRPTEPTGIVPFERPTRLFSEPEPLEVLAAVPDGPPALLRWRGGEERVLATYGPERLSLPWWNDACASDRDYFRIQDGRGRWLWAFREMKTGRWFAHGEWA